MVGGGVRCSMLLFASLVRRPVVYRGVLVQLFLQTVLGVAVRLQMYDFGAVLVGLLGFLQYFRPNRFPLLF